MISPGLWLLAPSKGSRDWARRTQGRDGALESQGWSIWPEVLGAALAGLLGMVTAASIECRRAEAERRFGCAVIAREILLMLEGRRTLVESKFKTAAFLRLVPINSLVRYRPLISPRVLPPDEMEEVEKAYRGFEVADRMMETVLSIHTGNHVISVGNPTRGMYWQYLEDRDRDQEDARLRAVAGRLQRYAGSPSWWERLLAELKIGFGL